MIKLFKSWLYPTYRKFFSRAYLYEGILKSGNGSVKCLFVDNDKFYLVVLQKLFRQSPTLIRTFRCWVPRLKHVLDSPHCGADICIAKILRRYEPYLHDSATFVMQTVVTQELDLKSDLRANKRFQYRRKETEKKIKKNGLTAKIAQSMDDFDFFYHRMAKPQILKFGEIALETSYDDMKQFFEKGVLILVNYEDKPVSGVLCYEKQGVFTAYRSGLLDADESYVNLGVMSAWYYFLIEYARDHGYQKIDFMGSFPFLNDGVYLHKQHWGANTMPSLNTDYGVYLFNRSSSETFARIIENIPLIVHMNNGLNGVISIPDEVELTQEIEKKLITQYGGTGLSGLKILRSHGTGDYMQLRMD